MTTIPPTCERARRWASLRTDGELSELEHALLDAHLARCGSCRAFARVTVELAGALASAPLERSGRLSLVPSRPRRLTGVVRTTLAAASVAAVGAATVVVGVGRQAAAVPVRTVAMVAAADTPNELRVLRRPALIGSSRPILRDRRFPGEPF